VGTLTTWLLAWLALNALVVVVRLVVSSQWYKERCAPRIGSKTSELRWWPDEIK
jgi:hypothetical protein